MDLIKGFCMAGNKSGQNNPVFGHRIKNGNHE